MSLDISLIRKSTMHNRHLNSSNSSLNKISPLPPQQMIWQTCLLKVVQTSILAHPGVKLLPLQMDKIRSFKKWKKRRGRRTGLFEWRQRLLRSEVLKKKSISREAISCFLKIKVLTRKRVMIAYTTIFLRSFSQEMDTDSETSFLS